MTTPNLGLIELTNSQGQYLNANETFAIIDALLGKVVKDKDLNAPPGSPADGDVYIVGPSPTGLWTGQANKITFWSADALEWVFVTPREGWKFEPTDEDITYRYSGSAWVEWSAGGGDWDALATPAISSGTLTINLADPTWYRVTLNQNVTTITFTNFPTGKVPVFAIEFVQDGTGGRTVTWPGSVVADDGGSIPSPATTAGAATIYTLSSSDNGTTYKLASGVENGFTVSVGAVNEAPLTTIASAATVNLATATSNTINISGTTTITAFGTIAAGAIRRLVFQGTLTLTHNATSLILPTGANIITTANDSAEFVSLGSGNWRCVRYQRADGDSLGNGTAAKQNIGTSGANVPLLDGSNTWSSNQTISANLTFSGNSRRILGDFSNGTPSNRLIFQTTSASSFTDVWWLPGSSVATAARSGFSAINDPTDLSNTAFSQFFQFNTDTRISAARTGTATYLPMTFYTSGSERLNLQTDGHFRPGADNTQNLGTASFRWKEVFAGTGTINTSDGNEKDVDPADWKVRSLTVSEIMAAKALSKEIGAYRFKSAIQQKGKAARMHIGMTVQRAIAIMEYNGLDPMAYGFICYDAWDEVVIEHKDEHKIVWIEPVLDDNGEEIEPGRFENGELVSQAWTEVRPAGGRYGFRTDELLLFIAAGFEARLSDLEGE